MEDCNRSHVFSLWD